MSAGEGTTRRRFLGGLAGGIVSLTAGPGAARGRRRPDAPDIDGPWELAFADTFDGDALDRSVWSTAFHFGRTLSSNHELEWYADDAVEVRDGRLRLIADRRRVEGRNSATGKRQAFDYVSGIVTTFGRFAQRYGYFEMRARLPYGRGLWPAFWLLPADKSWPPEIDVFEYPKPGGQIFVSNHFHNDDTGGEGTDITGIDPWFDPTAGFHHYSVDWRADEIVFYLDRQPVFRSRRYLPDQPMYLLANLAVGGKWPGPPDDSTAFPAVFEIDYIRAWRRVG